MLDMRQTETELAQVREQEINIGSKIQESLLLGHPPRNLSWINTAVLTIPSQKIDGDFYDFFEFNNQCFDVIIGDVMGKGVQAALFGAATKSQFTRAISILLSSSEQGKIPEPEEIVTFVHNEIVKQLIDLESFVTLCYARFNIKKQLINCVDCGHTKTIHFQNKTKTINLLQGKNMPLGFSEKEIYKQFSIPLESDDLFFFYSDGVTENRNEKGEDFYLSIHNANNKEGL